MKQRVAFVLLLSLFLMDALVVSGSGSGSRGASAAAAPTPAQQTFWRGLKKKLGDAKRENDEYLTGSCWRTQIKTLQDGSCPPGFRKFGWWCSPNCPHSAPVRCGPYCLPRGQSCFHEGLKKVSVITLILSRFHPLGWLAQKAIEDCAVATVGADRTIASRRLDTAATLCNEILEERTAIEKYNADTFAQFVKTVFADDMAKVKTQAADFETAAKALEKKVKKATPAAATSRLLPTKNSGEAEDDPLTACLPTMVQISEPLIRALTTALREKKGASNELAAIGNAMTQALFTCLNGRIAFPDGGTPFGEFWAGEAGGYAGGIVELMIESALAYFKEDKPNESVADKLKRVTNNMGAKFLVKLDPVGLVSLLYEVIPDFCDAPMLTDKVYSDPIPVMDDDIDNLALTVIGGAQVATANWDPTGDRKMVTFYFQNNIGHAIKLRLTAGGRRVKDRNGRKENKVAKDGWVAFAVPIAQVRATSLLVDMLLDKSVAKAALDAVKTALGVKLSSLKIYEGLTPTVPTRFAQISFWVPDTDTGELHISGTLSAAAAAMPTARAGAAGPAAAQAAAGPAAAGN